MAAKGPTAFGDSNTVKHELYGIQVLNEMESKPDKMVQVSSVESPKMSAQQRMM